MLYPDSSQESDIIPHGKLVAEVKEMGISVDGSCRTAKANAEELCGKEKCRTEAVNKWNSPSLEPVLLVLLMTLAQQ